MKEIRRLEESGKTHKTSDDGDGWLVEGSSAGVSGWASRGAACALESGRGGGGTDWGGSDTRSWNRGNGLNSSAASVGWSLNLTITDLGDNTSGADADGLGGHAADSWSWSGLG